MAQGFSLIQERRVEEARSLCRLWRHGRTGAEVLELVNSDENKVFGVTFKTPADEATGVAHILEHSVLCGSRKYPVKEPFVELLKGSLQTFLNAFTYPDKTCYPVASCNLQDFYNLVDVYLDAVFHPRLTEAVFQQEAWHVDPGADGDGAWRFKGVVYNEMKGAYSSPDSLLAEYVQHSLFPDVQYGKDSGGDPAAIPELTFERFMAFHRTLYHPSNARFYFYGDDPPARRLELLAEYLDGFQPLDSPAPEVRLQAPFVAPRRVDRAYPVEAEGDGSRAMAAVNWLLPEITDAETWHALHMLEHILVELPASPLRKALIDSGLGEDLAGVGLESELRQPYFSTGLKGVDPGQEARVEELTLGALEALARDGVPTGAVEAALNSIEFDLRENNTGRFPRGLSLMLQTLVPWLHGRDPLSPLAFEAPLARIKARLAAGERVFENLIRSCFLDNAHRTLVVLAPDQGLAGRLQAEEDARLERLRSSMGPQERAAVARSARQLQEQQERADSPEALASIPRLSPSDLDRRNRAIPLEEDTLSGVRLLAHDLDTSGLTYLDAGFSLRPLDAGLLPLVPVFGRALLEMGTSRRDFVDLSTLIARKTGGLEPTVLVTPVRGSAQAEAWLILRGKATADRTDALTDILREVLLEARFDDRERFRQIVLEEKARLEERLIPAGHQFVAQRLRAGLHEAGRVEELLDGVGQLAYLRGLAERVERDWVSVLGDLEAVRRAIFLRSNALFNLTVDAAGRRLVEPHLRSLAGSLDGTGPQAAEWILDAPPPAEGLAMPAQVNYVGKGLDLRAAGYVCHGSANVASKLLRAGWLWDRVRVRGGAYGAFCSLDRISGVMTFVSYRDPNVDSTLQAFDGSGAYLRAVDPASGELGKSVVGAIGEVDAHLLPDAKGYVSMVRRLAGETDELRQRMREEILAATTTDLAVFADVLEAALPSGRISVMGSRRALDESAVGSRLTVSSVL